MGRKRVKGTEKNDRLTVGINTDVYVGGGNDTVTLQGRVNGNAKGVHRVYVDNNDGVNNVYGFSWQDTLNLLNGSITDYGKTGNDIYFKNGKTTVWLRKPNNSRYYGGQVNAIQVEVVYDKWQNYKNVSFDYWFSDMTGGLTNFIYDPWARYYGAEKGHNILTVNPNSLKNESNPDELSKKEVKNPHIDLRETSKFKNINAVYAIDTKGSVIRGGKNYVELYGSRNGADELWAGTGGAYLLGNGGSGTDIYHGGSSDDVFVHGVPFLRANNKSVRTNEIVYGYTSGQDDIEYYGGYHSGIVKGRDVILNFTNGTMRIKDGAGKAIYMYSAYEDKSYVRTFGTPILAKGLSYQNNRQKLLVKAPFKGTVKSATYDSTVREIDASTVKTAVNIEGNTGNLTIRASQGGGTLYGRRGNDKLYGGKGVDVFLYHKKNKRGNDGHDTIYNYESGKDIIRIEQGKYALSTAGNDVIMKIDWPQNNRQGNKGVDYVRIINGVGKNIVIQDANGKKVTKKLYPNLPSYASWNKKTATVTFNAKTPATPFDVRKYDPSIRNLNGKAAVKRLNLTGNNQNNIIYAGKAGGVLSGLGGNDTLYGGAGKDTFVYANGGGNDVIYNYTANQDVIQIQSGKVDSYRMAGKEVILRIGKGSIHVKDAANKKITFVDAKGKTYTSIYKAAAGKNSLSYLTKVQGVSHTENKSLMHLSVKTNNTISNSTLTSHGQPASLTVKKNA